MVSRVAAPDQLAIRISGRTVVRPTPQFNKGQMASVADVGTAVDAWWNDAWWEGIVVHKETEDRIHVFFPGLKIPSLKLDCKTVLSPVSQQYFVVNFNFSTSMLFLFFRSKEGISFLLF